MARITGKNAKLKVESARTVVSVDTAMVDSGDHQHYTYQSYWDPTLFPVIKKNTVVVDPSLYAVDYINGKVTFATPNLLADAITVNKIEWVTTSDAADLYNWTVDAKIDMNDATGFQDQFHTKLSSFRGWVGTAESYHRNDLWFPFFTSAKPAYIEFWTDAGGLERFVGAAFVDMAEKVPMAGVVSEGVTFSGTGALVRLSS